jgi:L-ascorbate metabolism protein UlaG (beta-lactamase superfamily)
MVGEHSFLFDAITSLNELARDIDSIEADCIALYHGHEDYVVELESVVKKNEAKLISNFRLTGYLGEEREDRHPKSFGAICELPIGKAKLVSCNTCCSVLPDETYGGNQGDFVIERREETPYFTGDLALTTNMRQFSEKDFEVDVVILPVGGNLTKGPKEVLKAEEFNRYNRIIGVLFDTFPYIKIDHSVEKNILQHR